MHRHTFLTTGTLLLVALGCREPTGPGAEAGTPNAVASENVTRLALSNTWSTKAPMLYGRSYVSAATVNGNIYVVGGAVRKSDGTFPPTTTLQVYNLATNTWTTRKPVPLAVSHANGASAINGKLYLTAYNLGKRLFVYDPVTNAWTRKRDMPAIVGYGAQGVISGRLYVYSPGLMYGTTRALYRYNPTTDIWVKLAPPPPYTSGELPASGVIGGKFYVAGGEDYDYMAIPNLNVYDPATNTWKSRASMPVPLEAPAGAAIDGKLYVAGGQAPVSPYISRRLLVYDPLANQWTTEASMPTARYAAAGAAASGRFFVLGGWGTASDNLRVAEAYTP